MYLLFFEKVLVKKIKVPQKITTVKKIIQTWFNKGES